MHPFYPGARPHPARPSRTRARFITTTMPGRHSRIALCLCALLLAAPIGAPAQEDTPKAPDALAEPATSGPAAKTPDSTAIPAQPDFPAPDAQTAEQPSATTASPEPATPSVVTAAAPSAPQAAPPSPIETEIATLKSEFGTAVREATLARLRRYLSSFRDPKTIKRIEGRIERLTSPEQAYLDYIAKDALEKLTAIPSTSMESQYFLYVDRNPAKQIIALAFFDAEKKRVDILGLDLVSSGDIHKGGDYFETPTGVFDNQVDNFGYRALGTPNAEGWRGLGEKDSRVWDFGYQSGVKTYKNGTTKSQMRLLLHATDPVAGESRLGRIDSKGCIRISKGLNYFLDIHAILDYNYEKWAQAKPGNWLLRKERKPVSQPGRYLVIGDSAPVFDPEPALSASTAKPAAAPK